MRVTTPVGEFEIELKGMRIKDGVPVARIAMGAWSSEARLTRKDGLLLLRLGAAVAGGMILLRALGKALRPR